MAWHITQAQRTVLVIIINVSLVFIYSQTKICQTLTPSYSLEHTCLLFARKILAKERFCSMYLENPA